MRKNGAAAVLFLAASLFLTTSPAGAKPRGTRNGQLGVPPKDSWTCPASHPIKGNLTTRTGECIYHVPGGRFYDKTKPELCFATVEEARKTGCRRSKR